MVRDPWTRQYTPLVRVAAKIKKKGWRPGVMDHMWGDHHNGWAGWDKLNWSKVRLIPEGSDIYRVN